MARCKVQYAKGMFTRTASFIKKGKNEKEEYIRTILLHNNGNNFHPIIFYFEWKQTLLHCNHFKFTNSDANSVNWDHISISECSRL